HAVSAVNRVRDLVLQQREVRSGVHHPCDNTTRTVASLCQRVDQILGRDRPAGVMLQCSDVVQRGLAREQSGVGLLQLYGGCRLLTEDKRHLARITRLLLHRVQRDTDRPDLAVQLHTDELVHRQRRIGGRRGGGPVTPRDQSARDIEEAVVGEVALQDLLTELDRALRRAIEGGAVLLQHLAEPCVEVLLVDFEFRLKRVCHRFPLREVYLSGSSAYALAPCSSMNAAFFSQSFRSAFVRTRPDRKSTRLNSSHVKISYAVFCL